METKDSNGNILNEGDSVTIIKSLKVKDTHTVNAAVIHLDKSFTDLHVFTPVIAINASASQPLAVANTSHAPPLWRTVPLYIFNCTYRI